MADLLVTCWCEAREIKVSSERLARGETNSCGRPGCEPPGDAIEPVEHKWSEPEHKGALTVSDREVLADDTTDALVRAYVERYGDTLAQRTETFRKITAAARAEAEALLAIHAVTEARRLVAEDVAGSA